MTGATAAFRLDPESGIVLLQSRESLTYPEWETAVDAAAAAGRLRRVLSDRRRLAQVYPPGLVEGVTQYLRSRPAQLDGVRWALLMADRKAAHTAANAAMAVVETGLDIKVFTDTRLALAWLLGVYEQGDLARLEHWVDTAALG